VSAPTVKLSAWAAYLGVSRAPRAAEVQSNLILPPLTGPAALVLIGKG